MRPQSAVLNTSSMVAQAFLSQNVQVTSEGDTRKEGDDRIDGGRRPLIKETVDNGSEKILLLDNRASR